MSRFRAPAIILPLLLSAVVVASSLATRQPASSEEPPGFQPELPVAAAVFYPWYPSHWSAGPYFPLTNYTPELGFYSSTDASIIEQQLAMAEQAHLEAFISSWWGQGEESDLALQDILSVTEASASPIRWAAYYEAEGYGNPASSEIAADLDHLASTAFQSPAYLRIGGKPVLFVYDSGGGNCSLVDRWLDAEQQSGVDVYLSLKVLSGYASCPTQPDSWHEYDPSVWAYQNLPHSVSISPGFWKFLDPPLLARNPEYFSLAVEFAVRKGASWVIITTWNEWIEGTTIEPALEYGRTYLDLLCAQLPGPTPCLAATPTASPEPSTPTATTATPTATPTVTLAATPTATTTLVSSATINPPHAPTATPVVTAAATPHRTNPPLRRGDVDCSGSVDSVDALEILKIVADWPTAQSDCSSLVDPVTAIRAAADTDCTGGVDAIDVLATLRFVVGLSVGQKHPCTTIGEAMS